jgi:hypothetical protein
MHTRLWGDVSKIEAERDGIQDIAVQTDAGERNAICYPELSGRVQIGDRVLLNTIAVEMNLGTGGRDFVVAVAGRNVDAEPSGHMMKLRYTPLQMPVLSAEAPESLHHETLQQFTELDGVPVVCLELHSQLAAVCAGIKSEGDFRIAYIMTDGAALPLAFSRLVPELKHAGLLDVTLTAGQAFGGDIECITLFSALAADIIIVGQGPGNAGTGTELGFSGIEQGIAVNAAYSLNGKPIVVPRLSFADARERHQGISHHTWTVLSRVVLCPVVVPFPVLPDDQAARIQTDLAAVTLPKTHEWVAVDAEPGLSFLTERGIVVTTMGRTVAQDRAFFLAGSAAGRYAAMLCARCPNNPMTE